MKKRGVGKHGRRGETKALVILVLLKSSFEAISNSKQEGFVYDLASRVVRTGFMPIGRSDLKWNLKPYGISPKNANAIISGLEKDKAIKNKPLGMSLNILTLDGIVAIMEVLAASSYYILPANSLAETNEIKELGDGERPFLEALNRAFAECFLSVYGDAPFSPYVDPDSKWGKIITNSIMGENKRPLLSSGQVPEVLEIATKLRGELTIKFKLMYVWRVSIMIANGRDQESEKRRNFSLLSISERPRSYIEDPQTLITGHDSSYITFALERFVRLILIAHDPNLSYLSSELNENEEDLLTLKVLLGNERTTPFLSLFAKHLKITDGFSSNKD